MDALFVIHGRRDAEQLVGLVPSDLVDLAALGGYRGAFTRASVATSSLNFSPVKKTSRQESLVIAVYEDGKLTVQERGIACSSRHWCNVDRSGVHHAPTPLRCAANETIIFMRGRRPANTANART